MSNYYIKGYFQMTPEDQYDAEKALWDSLPQYEKERIDRRHNSMENARSDYFGTQYSRIIASWFNVVGDRMTAGEAIEQLKEYLKGRADVYELSDIYEMLTCGKSETEMAMSRYINEEIPKKELIKKLAATGLDTTGFENLPIDTLRSIESKVV